MGNMGSITADRLAQQLMQGATIISTAGAAYKKPLIPAVAATKGHITFPFDGTGGMGLKMQAMKRARGMISGQRATA